jgi:two-component system response regulator BaeR
MPTCKRILIVEDEAKIAKLLEDYLVDAGYSVDVLCDGTNAVEQILYDNPDCVVLDIMLPGKDGLTICRELRRNSDIPIVMITAKVDEIDRLLGLELGADDYICKPFSPREVVVRIRNILRRVGLMEVSTSLEKPTHILEYNSLLLDDERQSCQYQGEAVVLTSVEFRMLFALTKLPGKILNREQLMDCAYDDRRVVSDRTVDTHIKNIRRKLNVTDVAELIHSIYGRGYKVE